MNEEEPKVPDTKKVFAELHLLDDRIDEVLLKSRRIFLSDAVANESAKDVIRKLWYLELKDPGKPILFVINSPGGSVDAGFAIWDQIKMLTSPITTLVTGMAASMGSVLALCAPAEKRFCTPYARFMIHQPSVSALIRGHATDLEIHAKEIVKTRKQLVDLYAKETRKDPQVIDTAIERDTWMDPHEAKEFGLVHDIVSSYKNIV